MEIKRRTISLTGFSETSTELAEKPTFEECLPWLAINASMSKQKLISEGLHQEGFLDYNPVKQIYDELNDPTPDLVSGPLQVPVPDIVQVVGPKSVGRFATITDPFAFRLRLAAVEGLASSKCRSLSA